LELKIDKIECSQTDRLNQKCKEDPFVEINPQWDAGLFHCKKHFKERKGDKTFFTYKYLKKL